MPAKPPKPTKDTKPANAAKPLKPSSTKAVVKTKSNILTSKEGKERIGRFLDLLKQNGITHRMRNKKG